MKLMISDTVKNIKYYVATLLSIICSYQLTEVSAN